MPGDRKPLLGMCTPGFVSLGLAPSSRFPLFSKAADIVLYAMRKLFAIRYSPEGRHPYQKPVCAAQSSASPFSAKHASDPKIRRLGGVCFVGWSWHVR